MAIGHTVRADYLVVPAVPLWAAARLAAKAKLLDRSAVVVAFASWGWAL